MSTADNGFRCDQCDYVTHQHSNLIRHQRIHTGEKPFACPFPGCGKSFSVKCNLTVHERLHSDERPFACDVCDKTFKLKHHLTKHKRSHTGERPFKCDQCEFATFTSGDLKVHLRKHSDEKPFACDQCDYRCKHKSSLTTHLRIHTGEKPFKCPHCDYVARTQGHLATHLRQHTKKTPYKCFLCPEAFTTLQNLRSHLHKTHGGGPNCTHGLPAIYCSECGGNQFCLHQKLKSQCGKCIGGGGKLCKSKWCETIVTTDREIYDGYCLQCTVHLFPNRPVSRNYKTKENAVAKHITTAFPNVTWILDKRVMDGCSLRRPDMCADFGTHVIMVEVDENRHHGYDPMCVNRRTMELSKDIGHRPMVIIRFNPDSYRAADGKKVASCWSTAKETGLHRVPERQEAKWRKRLGVLTETIQKWIDNRPTKIVTIKMLFYGEEPITPPPMPTPPPDSPCYTIPTDSPTSHTSACTAPTTAMSQ